MFAPATLETWELVATSGLLAVGALIIAWSVAITVAYLLTRERRLAPHAEATTAPARAATSRPAEPVRERPEPVAA